MVNNKKLYKILVVLGLLLTMIMTLSLTQYTLTYAKEEQPPTAETGDNTENTYDRLDFDSGMLEQARKIIGSDTSLSDAQIAELHQIGFDDKQISILMAITQKDTGITPNDHSHTLLPVFIGCLLFIIILFSGIVFAHRKKHKSAIS